MQTISKKEYCRLLKVSVELQKMKVSVTNLTQALEEKGKNIKKLQDSVSYYKKTSQEECSSNSSVSNLCDILLDIDLLDLIGSHRFRIQISKMKYWNA